MRAARFLDTSDGYGPDGHNERLVGRAIRRRRDEVVVATKFGFRTPAGAERHGFPVGFAFGELAVNCRPSLVRRYAEQSLRELGSDRIDLYYPHFPDPQVPFADTVGAVAEIIAAGWCATSACRTSRRRSCARRMRCTRSPRCRRSGRYGARSTPSY